MSFSKRIAAALAAAAGFFTGKERFAAWRRLARGKRVVLIVLDTAVIAGGLNNFHPSLPVLAGVLLLAFFFHRRFFPPLSLAVAAVYGILLINTFDEVITIAPWVLRERLGLGIGAIVVLPLLVSVLVKLLGKFFSFWRLALLGATIMTALTANLMIIPPPPEKADLARLDPAVKPLFLFQPPLGRIETPRLLVLDEERRLLWVGYRHRAFTPPAAGWQPAALERYELDSGGRRTIAIDGAEVIGLALDPARGVVVASLARGGGGKNEGKAPARELAILSSAGDILGRLPLPGRRDDYFNHIFLDKGKIWINTGTTLLRTDYSLAALESIPLKASPTWTFCGGDYRDGVVYRAFGGSPLKGIFLRAFGLDAVEAESGRQLKAAQFNRSGLYDVKINPADGSLAAISTMVEAAQILLLDRQLNVQRRIDLPGVVRAFAPDFARRRLGAIEYYHGDFSLWDMDSGRELAATTLGAGSRALLAGAQGEFYAGSDIGLFRIDTELLLP